MPRRSRDSVPTHLSLSHPTISEVAGESSAFRPVVFGEALFDHFPDGTRVLGGAPFNVAWHLRGFKANPLLVTSVGQDPDGKRILEQMGAWGMDTAGVQIHPTKPTGHVRARFQDGQPRFEIVAKQAYDAISVQSLPRLHGPEPHNLLYFGSLCLRGETSAATLAYLREKLEAPVLVDVNLRDPWWGWEKTRRHIRGVDWLKVNDEEVGLLTRKPVTSAGEVLKAAEVLKAELGIQNIVVTLGSRGTVALMGGEPVRVEGRNLPDIVDTVGAGDAFTAVLALGIHGRWPPETLLQRASEFAAETCLTRGATSADPTLYLRTLREWNHAP